MSWTCPENSSILWAFHARNQWLFPVSSHPILLPPAVAGAPQAAMTTATPRTSFGPGRRCWDRPWGWLPGGKTTLRKCHGSLADKKHSKSNGLSDLGKFKGLGWKKMVEVGCIKRKERFRGQIYLLHRILQSTKSSGNKWVWKCLDHLGPAKLMLYNSLLLLS